MDISGSHPNAGVLDVEPGCAPVDVVAGWVKARKTALPDAYVPIIYCNRSFLTPIFNVLAAGDLHVVRDFRLWIATLDGTRQVQDMTGVTAVQYKRGRAQHPDGSWAEPPGPAVTEGHFDESLVYDDEWHHNPCPAAGRGPFALRSGNGPRPGSPPSGQSDPGREGAQGVLE